MRARIGAIALLAVTAAALAVPAAAQHGASFILPELERAALESAGGVPDPLEQEALEIVAELRGLVERGKDTRALLRRAAGGDRVALQNRVWDLEREEHRRILALTKNVLEQKEAGRDVEALDEALKKGLIRAFPVYLEAIDAREEELIGLRKEYDEASPEERLVAEDRLLDQIRRQRTAYRRVLELTEAMQSLGLDASEQRTTLRDQLKLGADLLAARAQLARESIDDLTPRIETSPDDADLAAALRVAESRLERSTDSLAIAVELLDKIGAPTTEYSEILVETTGELQPGLLDRDVVSGLFERWSRRALEEIRQRGPGWIARALLVILTLVLFRIAAWIVRAIVSRSVRSDRFRVSRLLQTTLVSWSSHAVMGIGFLVVLSQVGFEIGPVLAGLGIAGLAVGFALQDSLSNFASGAMILMYRPFDEGDVVEVAGVSGQVRHMTLVSTTILTFDNQTLIIPNNKVWGDVIRNVTFQTTRRVDLLFGVAYGEDVDRVEAVLRDVLANHDKVLAEPEPTVEVHELGESSVNLVVRPWVRTEDYWPVYWSLTRAVKKRFDAEGISIPFPQRDLHLIPEETD